MADDKQFAPDPGVYAEMAQAMQPMTKPPEPVVTGELKVTQADIKRADDWAYMLGRMGGVILDQSHRKGLAAQFAAHRTAHALPGDVGTAGMKIAREIVATDLDDAIQHCDADWEGMSRTAMEAIDAALTPSALSGDVGTGRFRDLVAAAIAVVQQADALDEIAIPALSSLRDALQAEGAGDE